MPSNPFQTTRNASPANFSFSPSTSYARDNIAVPSTSSLTAAQHATQADTDFEDRLPEPATITALPTPAVGS